MEIRNSLQKEGWFLSEDGVKEICQDGIKIPEAVIKKALNMDLKNIGEKHLPENLARNKIEFIEGPLVLQIQKLRNVLVPKDLDVSLDKSADKLFRLVLTDGVLTCAAVQTTSILNLDNNTAPGTKLKITGKVFISQGFLLLMKSNTDIIGGVVDKLIESWEMKKSLASYNRSDIKREEGPPSFIPFEQMGKDSNWQQESNDGFRALESSLKKKDGDEEFEKQRKLIIEAAIQESKSKNNSSNAKQSQIQQDKNLAVILDMGFSTEQAMDTLRSTSNDLQGAINILIKDSKEIKSSKLENKEIKSTTSTLKDNKITMTINKNNKSTGLKESKGAEQLINVKIQSSGNNPIAKQNGAKIIGIKESSSIFDKTANSANKGGVVKNNDFNTSSNNVTDFKSNRRKGVRNDADGYDDHHYKPAPATLFDFVNSKIPNKKKSNEEIVNNASKEEVLVNNNEISISTSSKEEKTQSSENVLISKKINLSEENKNNLNSVQQKTNTTNSRNNETNHHPPPINNLPPRLLKKQMQEEMERNAFHGRYSFADDPKNLQKQYDINTRGPVNNKKLWNEEKSAKKLVDLNNKELDNIKNIENKNTLSSKDSKDKLGSNGNHNQPKNYNKSYESKIEYDNSYNNRFLQNKDPRDGRQGMMTFPRGQNNYPDPSYQYNGPSYINGYPRHSVDIGYVQQAMEAINLGSKPHQDSESNGNTLKKDNVNRGGEDVTYYNKSRINSDGFKEKGEQIIKWRAGDKCLARWKDKQLYKCQIVQVHPRLLVNFIDYDSTEPSNINDLYPLNNASYDIKNGLEPIPLPNASIKSGYTKQSQQSKVTDNSVQKLNNKQMLPVIALNNQKHVHHAIPQHLMAQQQTQNIPVHMNHGVNNANNQFVHDSVKNNNSLINSSNLINPQSLINIESNQQVIGKNSNEMINSTGVNHQLMGQNSENMVDPNNLHYNNHYQQEIQNIAGIGGQIVYNQQGAILQNQGMHNLSMHSNSGNVLYQPAPLPQQHLNSHYSLQAAHAFNHNALNMNSLQMGGPGRSTGTMIGSMVNPSLHPQSYIVQANLPNIGNMGLTYLAQSQGEYMTDINSINNSIEIDNDYKACRPRRPENHQNKQLYKPPPKDNVK